SEAHRESAAYRRHAGPVQVIDDGDRDPREVARGLTVVLGAVLILIVVIETRATRNREYLGNDIEVDGNKGCALLVTALHIFAERRVGIGAQSRVGGERAGNRAYRRQAVRTAC